MSTDIETGKAGPFFENFLNDYRLAPVGSAI